jgi:hypothetical protein
MGFILPTQSFTLPTQSVVFPLRVLTPQLRVVTAWQGTAAPGATVSNAVGGNGGRHSVEGGPRREPSRRSIDIDPGAASRVQLDSAAGKQDVRHRLLDNAALRRRGATRSPKVSVAPGALHAVGMHKSYLSLAGRKLRRCNAAKTTTRGAIYDALISRSGT